MTKPRSLAIAALMLLALATVNGTLAQKAGPLTPQAKGSQSRQADHSAAKTTTGAVLGFSETKPADGRSVAVEGGYLTPYEVTLPGTDITFTMLPIPGGVVQLGPPEGDEPPRAEGFGFSPSVRVQVEPCWIGRCEVTWAEYWRYMALNESFAKLQKLRDLAGQNESKTVSILKKRDALWTRVSRQPEYVDGVTSPTPLYDPDVTYESGDDPDLPAVTMTNYAARQYTKWLSRTTGADYRLPFEAEWEHAARAGGDGRGVSDLSAIAWHTDNSDFAAHPVAKLAPNAWGLHDTIGNAAEWVLGDPQAEPPTNGDQPIPAAQAIAWPTKRDPLMAKGGYWDADPELCTAASRMLSDNRSWKEQDPNLPRSPWWFSDYPAGGVGFRLLRPLKPMDDQTRRRAWEIDSADLQDDVDHRVKIGRRGKLDFVDPKLPQALKQLEEPEVSALLQ